MEAELRYLLRRAISQQEREASACQGKPAFATSQQARESLPRRTMHGRVAVYRCTVCRKWHVGSHLSTAARERRPMRIIGGDDEETRS